jgi:predicted helicase
VGISARAHDHGLRSGIALPLWHRFALQDAQAKFRDGLTPHKFQLCVFDEAHHTCVSDSASLDDKSMSIALADDNISITTRLFMTATPHRASAK